MDYLTEKINIHLCSYIEAVPVRVVEPELTPNVTRIILAEP
jgi:hypothetical protein